jgi:hypothetical protein
MNRGNDAIPSTELLVRKDVWRLRPGGRVQFQIQFGEYGGSYVNHCHNTVHEDFACSRPVRTAAVVAAGAVPARVSLVPRSSGRSYRPLDHSYAIWMCFENAVSRGFVGVKFGRVACGQSPLAGVF